MLLILIAGPVFAQQTEISSSALRLAIDRRSGDLLAFDDVTGGAGYLARGPVPMFQLQLTDAERQSHWTDSRAADGVAVRREVEGPDTTLTVTYSQVEEGIDATVTVRARAEEPAVRFRIAVANESDQIIEQIVFPLLRIKRPLGPLPDDDRLFVPGGDGYVAGPDAMERQRWHYRGYPGNASMQVSAYYDDAAGLSVICEDTKGEPKLLGASVDDEHVSLAAWLRCPFAAGQDYESSWIAVQPCAGSWMMAADQYRQWAREQWWAKPKTGEQAPPQWIADSPLVLSAQFRPLGTGEWLVPLDRWPEFARTWREATGASSVMIESRYWEHSGVYTSPFYFPLHPSPDVVSETLARVQEEDVHVQAMVAGLKWMIEREPFHTPHYSILGFDGRQGFEEEGKPVCVVGRDGEVMVREAYFTWDGDHAFMCPATEFAKEHFRNTARVLAQAGFDLFEFDQMNGGECPPCYSTEHGHPPGEGRWMQQAIAELMMIAREEGRKHNPAFALSLEDPAELLIPYLDTYISRVNHVVNWPAAGPGSEVVPAFEYVYHPLIASTNVDLQHTSRPDDFLLLRTARSFVYGAGLSTQLTPWQIMADYGKDDLFPTPQKMGAAQLTLLRNLVRLHDGPAKPFLTRGEMLRTLPLDVPEAAYTLRYQKGTDSEEVEVKQPAVLHSAWALPDGRVAFFFANPTREPVDVPFAARTAEWQATAGSRIHVYVNGEPEGARGLQALRRITVPGLSAAMVEFPGDG
jgi:hypothetical protein